MFNIYKNKKNFGFFVAEENIIENSIVKADQLS